MATLEEQLKAFGLYPEHPPATAAVQAFGFSKDDLIVLAKDLDQEISQNKGLFEL